MFLVLKISEGEGNALMDGLKVKVMHEKDEDDAWLASCRAMKPQLNVFVPPPSMTLDVTHACSLLGLQLVPFRIPRGEESTLSMLAWLIEFASYFLENFQEERVMEMFMVTYFNDAQIPLSPKEKLVDDARKNSK